MVIRRSGLAALLAALVVLSACGGESPPEDVVGAPEQDTEETDGLDGVVRVYSTVTQDTVDVVVDGFEAANPGVTVEVFRAPTGEFNARVAAERRDGEIRADVFWLTDPLSMQQFDADGLLRAWAPAGAEAVPEEHRTDTFWGTRLLNLVIVAAADLDPVPASWWALTDPAYEGGVAIPDPGFAGSAFGALGHLALDDDHGLAYYAALADNGAVQVNAPGEVVNGVAEGRFVAGMTLDRMVRDAVEDGSPVELVWPEPGAIAVSSPIAVLDASEAEAAEAFVEYVLSEPAQQDIAGTGWQPIHPSVAWVHQLGPVVVPDWEAAFARQEELLDDYRAVFGG